MTSLVLTQPRHLQRLSDIALLLVAVVWGTSYGVAKGALAFYPVLGFLAVRFSLTFLLLSPALWAATPRQRQHALIAGLPLGGMMLAIFLCETYGVAHTQASNAAFLISLCVVFTPFVEWWMLGRKPAPAIFVFAAVSLVGAGLLSGGLESQFGYGDALMLCAAMLRAVGVCQTSKWTQGRDAPALALTAVQSGVIAVGCLALGLASQEGLPALPSSPAFWQMVAYLVIGCTVFAFFAQNWALKHSSPSRVTLLTSSEPAFGALFAVLWLGESLSFTAWVGGGLIVASALWVCACRAD
ncbi:DMT family transporter [Rhodoferax aquaticus]|uniref:DMT family transporter n=1 Tax=Rhodoferax aquaticus TaxID=2527691 RepID=A0A515EQ72_9BURK|nr:DMT family transporter [Rhodoferax aquaticus]QDL54807.1 DMT family transporter [Rhodoferax aquaticus]